MALKQKKRGLIFVISGPSGSGKTTLLERLFKSRALKAEKISKSVSLTTRQPRSGEKNGRDYIFISKGEFRRLLGERKILEWTRYLGYYYGTPLDFAKRQFRSGKHAILCLDLKGVSKIRRLYPKNSVTIFIAPPSLADLHKRISGRCAKTKREEVLRRINKAKEELGTQKNFDYRIINKDIGAASKELEGIVLGELKKLKGES